MKFAPLAVAACMLFALALAGCGGGGAPAAVESPAPVPVPPPDPKPDPVPEVPPPVETPFEIMLRHFNRCETPRTGLGASGYAFPDQQGTLADELIFLGTWLDDSYLWYRELPVVDWRQFNDPVAYFKVLKTTALTASGQPKDKYHFTYDSERWEELQTRGSSTGYGVAWARTSVTVPRLWFATVIEPGSPADAAGLRRGDQLLEIDGIDFQNAAGQADVAAINAALSPAAAGLTHHFKVLRAGAPVAVPLTSAKVSALPVKNAKVIDDGGRKVGYLNFASHNAVSERLLIEAMTGFRDAGVDDLVLDMRYNGGGLLFVASELAYMIAGPAATANKVFERPLYNDKAKPHAPIMFRSEAWGYRTPQPATAGAPLPTLGLRRVTVLTTAGTCSASESVINSLRGVDVEVILVGGATCGKPYAFTPVPNCGTTYFAIEFQGVNQKDFGDYADGFAPTCRASDDLSREQGDPAEGMLAMALARQRTGACPANAAGLRASAVSLLPVRSPVEEIAIHQR